MLSWECIHWRIAFNNVLFGMNAVFSEAQVVQRIINFVKPGFRDRAVHDKLKLENYSAIELDLPVKHVFYNFQAEFLCFFAYCIVC